MGVPGLWKELQSHGCDTALARLSELKLASSSSSSSISPTLRLGIDVSSWLFHAQKSLGGRNPQLRLLFYRLCRLLAVPNISPVFVFDGPLRPKEKRGKVVQRYREAAFNSDFKDLIIAFGFIVYDALGEAEAETARMIQDDTLDAIMSDDVDCFVFGARLVIRNWGQELSGSKARSDYVTEQSASECPSASSGDEQARIPSSQQPLLSVLDRHALGTNLITYFRASSLEEQGITQSGLILVAILSGGDYDVQGLPRCGAKISMALAKAGFGDTLITGLKVHCATPLHDHHSNRLAAPEASKAWPSFLAEWRDSVRHELSTNESGHLGRRFKKLAQSAAFAELLSTKASLSVLGSYVWPLTAKGKSVFQSSEINVGKIGQLCQDLFHWTAPHTLETFRNNLWQGCAVRELSGEGIFNLRRYAVKAKNNITKRAPNQGANISSFFAVKVKPLEESISNQTEDQEIASVVSSIAGQRENGSTGYVKEIRVICDVKAYVDLAKEGLDSHATFHDFEEGEVPPSSQSTTSSPRKRRPLTDPEKLLRMWIAQDIVKRSISAAKELYKYHYRRKTSKASNSEKKVLQSTATHRQDRLDSFFLGGKANITPHIVKVSPLKRRAPLQSSSQSSSLSSAPSRSPSPTFQSPLKTSSDTQAKTLPASKIIIPGWDSDILDSSDEETAMKTYDDFYDTNDDSTLPAITIPMSNKHNTLQSIPADESVEFISANIIPARRKNSTNTASMPIEVSDESDQD